MIKTENLTKVYNGKKAVDNLNLEVADGITFGFLGLNGAGKTTTVRMLATISDPTSGKASVYGHDIVNDIREIEVLCDRVCIIHKGKIVFSGDAEKLKRGKGTSDELEENVTKLLKGEIVE